MNPSLSARTETDAASPGTRRASAKDPLPSVSSSPRLSSGAAGVLAVLALVAALLAWLWPIGIGGKMLVGGDVTQFFIGLMGFLGDSLRAGELPERPVGLWFFRGWRRARWGLYPAHVVLYR